MNLTAISTVITLVPRIIDAVKTAESYIRGPSRGEEKKKTATENVIDEVRESVESARKANFNDESIKWWEVILAAKELGPLIGDVIDSVVALANFLSKYEDKAIPKSDPELIN